MNGSEIYCYQLCCPPSPECRMKAQRCNTLRAWSTGLGKGLGHFICSTSLWITIVFAYHFRCFFVSLLILMIIRGNCLLPLIKAIVTEPNNCYEAVDSEGIFKIKQSSVVSLERRTKLEPLGWELTIKSNYAKIVWHSLVQGFKLRSPISVLTTTTVSVSTPHKV